MANSTVALKLYAVDKSFKFFKDDEEKAWKGEFSFIQAADTQYGMMDGIKNGRVGDRWDEEISLSNQTVEAINRMNPKPKFIVICGDLTDAFPEDYPEMKARQISDFKLAFSKLDKDIPLVCVCGNHDIGNTPTQETVDRYRSSYGCDYFSFWCSGVLFMVINSQYFWDSSKVERLAEEHENWLNEQLDMISSSNCKHAVIFQHIPYFLFDPNEGDNGIFTFPPQFRKQMLEKLSKAGVSAIFCGHYHRNAGGLYRSVDGISMEQVVTSAIGAQLGNDPHGVRLVKVYEDKLIHRYYALDEIPIDITF